MSVTAPNTELCEGLSNALHLYETTNVRSLQGVLLALTLASVANAFFSFLTCLLPRRHIMKGVVFSLVILPLAILLPFLVLNSRRDAMRLRQFNVSDAAELDLQARICGIILPRHQKHILSRSHTSYYDFETNGRNNDSWQLYIVLLFAGATIALGTRIFLSIAINMYRDGTYYYNADAHIDGSINRPGHPFSMKQHTPGEIQQLLRTLRVEIQHDTTTHSPEIADTNDNDNTNIHRTVVIRDKECAICLDEMRDNVSRLQCGHIFHEKCLEKWIHTASFHTVCPMCKAPIWEEPAARISWEGTRDTTTSTFTTSTSTSSPSSSSTSSILEEEEQVNTIMRTGREAAAPQEGQVVVSLQHGHEEPLVENNNISEQSRRLQPEEGSISLAIDEETCNLVDPHEIV